jgi:hypothetical protein
MLGANIMISGEGQDKKGICRVKIIPSKPEKICLILPPAYSGEREGKSRLIPPPFEEKKEEEIGNRRPAKQKEEKRNKSRQNPNNFTHILMQVNQKKLSLPAFRNYNNV